RKQLEDYQEEIDDYQNMMYAHDRYGMLLVFQAMDAAGKDSTIRHVMSGINAHGVEVSAFKAPSKEELDHDFMWRTTRKFPPRGRVGIFNRSYYEEVLVVKVHPKIIQKYQRIPLEQIQDLDLVWEQRYEDIRNLESYAYRNGIRVVKFFLNVSKEEQKNRFLARIDTPSKNWKFSGGDVEERQHWDSYMKAYEEAINATATDEAPWYLVPADDKKNMRLIVSQIILQQMAKLDMSYPELDPEAKAELENYRKRLEAES
ncbi:MAG: PPK2 family polyphosphate kinase, partial [Bacteroidota bacterium]